MKQRRNLKNEGRVFCTKQQNKNTASLASHSCTVETLLSKREDRSKDCNDQSKLIIKPKNLNRLC